MTDERLPSPLRPMAWTGQRWKVLAQKDPRASGPSGTGYSAEVVDRARKTWGAWAAAANLEPGLSEPVTDGAVRYLQLGFPAEVVAGLLFSRLGRATAVDLSHIDKERAYVQRVLKDAPTLVETGVIKGPAGDAILREYGRRLEALDEWRMPLVTGLVPAASASTLAGALAASAQIPSVTPVAVQAPAPPIEPPGPAFSLSSVFAEHSVLILASLGAFLLVVATVLFELYGTIGLGGGVRLAAVVALAVLFAVAGVLARRRQGLEAVGHIYVAIAAVLLPLVGLAAWTFLDLGAGGITVYQAFAITAAACAGSYGLLAQRLELRPYGAMAGLAVLVAAVALSGWIGGDYWLPAGVALTPAVYAVWQRLWTSPAFIDFQWFAHAGAVIALGDAARYGDDGWLWTVTLLGLAAAYLTWNAVAHQPLRAWLGEGAVILAATAATGPLGLNSYHFALPLVAAAPVILLSRKSDRFGVVGEWFRPHVAHLHIAVAAGLALAEAQSFELNQPWSLATALAIAAALYAADYALGPTVLTGATLRAAVLLALATSGRAAGLGPWTAALTALGLVAFALPFTSDRLAKLRPFASSFYYVGLLLVAGELYEGSIGAGQWPVPVALAISAVAFGAAAELGAVRFSAYVARAVFSVAWFAGVDALAAGDWRGPFDALLALFYVALGQLRRLAKRSTATAGRRWLVHLSALAGLVLCFSGPIDNTWWRLAAAAASLTVAYWWLASVRTEREMPWLAWVAVSVAMSSLALAALPGSSPGAGIAGSALALTALWWVVRTRLPRERLDEAGLVVLTLLVVVGMSVASVQGWLEWPQAIAVLLAAAFFMAWSELDVATYLRSWRPVERCAASLSCVVGLAVAAAVLRLDTSLFGLYALAAASLHAEWSLRTREQLQRWYAIAIVLCAAPAIFLWPYANAAPLVAAVELVGVAVVVVRSAVRSRQWWLACPGVLVLAPALHFALAGSGIHDPHVERAAFAALAWAAGLAGVVIRTQFGSRWSLSTEAGAAAIATSVLLVMAIQSDADQAGVSLLAFSALIYVVAVQERSREALPFAPAAALLGTIVLLSSHGADTIYYAAAFGVAGLVTWGLGLGVHQWIGRTSLVDMHRYLGLGLLLAAGVAGFGFPDHTGAASLGAVLATVAFVVTGAVLYADARTYDWRLNLHVAIVAAATATFFAARFVNLQSWELAGPGLGLITVGITLRRERAFNVDPWLRRLIVAVGLGLVFGWAAAFTVTGDIWWLVALLIEGALAVGAGVALRSRVLLAGGGGALAFASLRALLLIAQAGYLFVAFGVVALVLLVIATGLALGRGRYLRGAREVREQMATWD